MNNSCFLITGKLDIVDLDRLMNSYKNISNKIFVTWDDLSNDIVDKLKKSGFIMKLLDKRLCPDGSGPIQTLQAYEGLIIAKELGYTHCLKSRSDIFSDNFDKILEINQKMYNKKILVTNGMQTTACYFLDLFIYADVDTLIKFHKIQPPSDKRYPEFFQQEEYYGKKDLTLSEIKELFDFTLHEYFKNEITIFWKRPQHWKDSFKTVPYVDLLGEYCKSNFVFV